MADRYKAIAMNLGYQFKDTQLLDRALTHRSAGKDNNERMEFLGDSIVNFVVANFLFDTFPKANEGELSRLRATYVKGETLAELALELKLDQFLVLGQGEHKSGGYQRPSILACALEGVIGAILLDSDFETCKTTLSRWYQPLLDNVDIDQQFIDPKTMLQEYLQARRKPIPLYKTVETIGQAHEHVFVVHCLIEILNDPVEGRGSSRRKAEQEAAKKTLEILKND